MAVNVSTMAPKTRSFPWTTSLTYGVALAVAGVSIGPVLYAILGGFRSNAQINAHPAGLPSPWVWETYANVLTKATFWSAAGNSLIIAASSTVGVTVLGVCAAFVLCRYRFRGREGLYTFFVIGLLFPATAGILPLFLLARIASTVFSKRCRVGKFVQALPLLGPAVVVLVAGEWVGCVLGPGDALSKVE